MRIIQQQKEALAYTTFLQRESMVRHHSYDEELAQYERIGAGDLAVIPSCTELFTSDSTGTLSDDPLRNKIYLFIASVTLVTRFCMEGGLEPELAYNLSDLYIQRVDHCTTIEDVYDLHLQMITDFTERVSSLKTADIYSKSVILCMDYVYYHLHETITVPELANYVNLAPTYLSAVFKKEMGISVSEYIRQKRVEAAENMLKYSDYSYLDISTYLAFSSQSHFTKIFKQYTGYTPKEYRNRFFRHKWA